MSSDNKKGFAHKQPPGYNPDPALVTAINTNLRDEMLPCAVAFKIAKELEVMPLEVGQAADFLNFSLAKCQLGLFGYLPEKKIVKAETAAGPELLEAIRAALQADRLACADAWEIAERFKLTRLKVSGVCEGQGIKVKPCQLGAF